MKTGTFSPLSDVFLTIAKKHNLKNKMDASYACHIVNKLIHTIFTTKGKKNNATATDLKNGIISITVQSSIQAQEITLHKLEILSSLQEKGYDIKSMRIHIQ